MIDNIDFCVDYEKMFNNIVTSGVTYILDSNKEKPIKALVLGVSGGIDSALTAVIARAVCDSLYEIYEYTCSLLGVVMPIESNKQDETLRGENVCYAFCDQYYTAELDEAYRVLCKAIDPSDDAWTTTDNGVDVEATMIHREKVRKGNIKARLRMINLYNDANSNDGIVLSTDNLTELLLGFWTLHGDVGDFGFIQSLWKTEVYGMAKWLAESDNEFITSANERLALLQCISATPTDGLGVTETDFDQLGYDSYEKIDKVLLNFFNVSKILIEPDTKDKEKLSSALADMSNDPVIKRYNSTHFKRNNPYNIPRKEIIGG